MRIVQVTPVVAFGDAVGNETVALKKMLQEAGYNTEIYYLNGIDSRLPKNTAKPISKMKVNKDDILLYHMATGTDLNYMLEKYDCHKIIRYHNITPPEFFKGINDSAFTGCAEGYRGVKYLADKMDYILADSSYNLGDLKRMGYSCDGEVIPILLDFEDYKKKPNEAIVQKYQDGYTNFLFTGRVVPNKRPEDVIRAFYCYKKYINEKSRLFLVGNYTGMEKYYNRLQAYIKELGLSDVIFSGHIKFDEILAYYSIADAFVCMSEHEGFCVPLLESMSFDVPIIAYNSSAIGETLGGSGILLEDKDPKYVAEWMNKLVTDQELRETVIANERERLAYFQYENMKKLFLDCFARLSADVQKG